MNIQDVKVGMRVRTRWVGELGWPKGAFVSEAGTVLRLATYCDPPVIHVLMDTDKVVQFFPGNVEPIPSLAVGDRVRTIRTRYGLECASRMGSQWTPITGKVALLHESGNVDILLDESGTSSGLMSPEDLEKL